MNTPDLFDAPIIQSGSSIVPRARRNNPHTSVQAALSAIGLSNAHRIAILADLKLHGISTGHEIAARVGLTYQQISKRLPELMEQGKIERIVTGHRWDGKESKEIFWTRPSPAGRPCCVWQCSKREQS